MKLPKFFEHLKRKWQIKSNWDLIMIMIVFSLAGMSIGFFRKPIFVYLHITHFTPLWIKVLVYIPLIPPIYQINLLFYGFLLGQFNFFWEKEKRLARFLYKSIIRSKSTSTI